MQPKFKSWYRTELRTRIECGLAGVFYMLCAAVILAVSFQIAR